MKNYVIGDIHGRIGALKQALKRSTFDYTQDRLIILGDVVDGGKHSKQCVDELLKIKNLIFIYGNHDLWFLNWIKTGKEPREWVSQGGDATIKSYGCKNTLVPASHKKFFNKGVGYYIYEKILFVHGGFDPTKSIKNQPLQDLVWDRSIIEYAKQSPIKGYKHVFVGHTTTQTQASEPKALHQDTTKPITYNNLTMMDTCAGGTGKLSIMEIHSRKFWQSDFQPSPLPKPKYKIGDLVHFRQQGKHYTGKVVSIDYYPTGEYRYDVMCSKPEKILIKHIFEIDL